MVRRSVWRKVWSNKGCGRVRRTVSVEEGVESVRMKMWRVPRSMLKVS
jgi:hypothetical protein